MTTIGDEQTTYDVGGMLLPRPFQIRRFGHFGYNCRDLPAMLRFYIDDLGLVESDRSDRIALRQSEQVQAGLDEVERYLYFTRAGTEHHQFVLMSDRLWELVGSDSTHDSINQVTWQVGSIAEVMAAADFLHGRGEAVMRVGRDMPGSNWHTYLYDADTFIHELYYGMEQVGWDGRSKPRELWGTDGATEAPPLPIAPESRELQRARDAGVDLGGGFTVPALVEEEGFDVDGVVLPRPFKVVRVGPVSLYSDDLDAAVAFHTEVLGFEVRADVEWDGHRGVQLGTGTDHHQLTVYESSLRAALGQPPDRDAMALGLQVANYRQLCAAVAHLEQRGAKLVTVAPELVGGFDYVAHVLDPDGNLVQLYYAMTQVGGDDGGAAPAVDPSEWPETISAPALPFAGEQFVGPWG